MSEEIGPPRPQKSLTKMERVDYDTHLGNVARELLDRVEGRQKIVMTGEEFAVWFPDLDQEKVKLVLEEQKKLVDMGVGVKEAIERFSAILGAMERYPEAPDFDGYTVGHNRRVSEVAERIYAEWYKKTGLVEGEGDVLRLVGLAGIGHDLGKLMWPNEILVSTGKMGDDQRRIIQTHPVVSLALLAPFEGVGEMIAPLLMHHERWDGTGYPLGLLRTAIPMWARIFALADIYDATRGSRPYRGKMEPDAVRKIFSEGRGKSFDPDLVLMVLGLIATDIDELYKKDGVEEVWSSIHIASQTAIPVENWPGQNKVAKK